ncbi:glycosyltransferase family 39 protein [Oryzobacter telluris]|uniref:glycosyltransferase family 39 protein n=1 Tax=Oryzobacter telluris TaxID=3149179 RepID=UPI00370D515D
MSAATDRVTRDQTAPGDERGARAPWSGTPLTRRDVAVAAVIAAVVVVVAIVWRSPIVPTDPWHYVRSALEFPSANWVPLGFTRYGIILATIPPAFVFKNAEASYYFWPLVSAAMLSASLYLVGRRLWSPVAGLVAVVVLFTNTIVFFNLSRGYPDIMSMALVMTALLTALLARDRGFTGKSAIAWLLVTGFLLGWSFEVRETGMLAWPIVLAVLWQRGRVLRNLAIVAAPVLAWAALDVGISGLVYGDPLLKLHTLTGTNPTGVGNAPPPPPTRIDDADRTRWGYFLSIPKAALERGDGVWLVVSGIVAALAIVARNRGLRLAAFGFISVYGVNLLLGGVLFPKRPFGTLIVPRYWIQYFPFIALVIGGLVAVAAAWLMRRSSLSGKGAGALVTAGVAIVGLAWPVYHAVTYVPTVQAFAINGGDGLQQLRAHLAAEKFETTEVWTDWETKRMLPAYQRPIWGGEKVWKGTPKSLTGAGVPEAGDAVLIFSADDAVCDHCRRALEPWAAKNPTIPPTWDLTWEDAAHTVQFYVVR